MTSQHKELVAELGKNREEIFKLRSTLNEIDKEKESWFKKKEELSSKIKEAIQKIKSSKAERDSLTKEVKDLKPKRDSINNEIKIKLRDLSKIKKEKAELVKSLGIKEPPYKIKQQMEKLEFKIETETVSFEKEKELMKNIKHLKKLYDDSSDILATNKKIRELSDLIKKLGKEANEIHKLVQEKAKKSQVLHEEILKLSDEIDKTDVEEEDAFKKFSELKKQFNELNSQLKEKLKLMNDVKSQLDKMHLERQEKRKQEEESFLKTKEEEVEQKIRRGEKLTTEDLLVFQKMR